MRDDDEEDDDESSSLDDEDVQRQGGQQEFSDDDEESSAMSDYNPDERVRNLINNRASEPEIVNRQVQALRNRPPLPHA